MRTKGSCRFKSYHKVEVWDHDFLVWKPIQKSHPTLEQAIEAAPEGMFRVLTISDDGTKTFGEKRIK